MVDVTINGRRYRLTKEDVVQRLAAVEPGPVRVHGVEVEGKLYPVKQAFACVTGLDPLDFTTQQARSVFERLGLTVRRV